MKEFIIYLRDFLKFWPPNMAVVRAFEAEILKKNVLLKSPSLDLGCGDGKFTKIVFGRLDSGIDIDKNEIRRAKGMDAYSMLHLADAHHIPYPDEHFSFIFSNCVIEHINDPEHLIEEVARVLNDKGEFVFTTWTPRFNRSLLIHKKWYVRWKSEALKHYSIKSVQEWKEVLQKKGLKIVWTETYIDCDKVKYLDLMELISLIGVWKFRLINLYKLLVPLFPDFLITKFANSLEKKFKNDTNKGNGCAVAIKAVKLSTG